MILYENGNTTQQNSGTNLTLTNTIEAPLKIDLYGNTSQEGTPTPDNPVSLNVVSGDNTINIIGKNLCDSGEFTLGTTTSTIQWSKAPSSYIPVNEGETYTLSYYVNSVKQVNNTYGYAYSYIYDENKTRIGTSDFLVTNSANNSTKTIPSGVAYIKVSYGVKGDSGTKFIAQLEKGSTQTSFEEHKEQTYELNLGKNLLDKNNVTLGIRISNVGLDYTDTNYYTSPFIKVEPNTTYTKNSPTADAYHRFAFYTTNDVSGFITISSSNSAATPSNCRYIRMCGLQTELDTTQVEKGSQATSYSPYFTPIELCKIGDYKDSIYYQASSKNIFDKNTAEYRTGYLKNENGEEQTTNLSSYLSSYIAVKPNTQYTIQGTLRNTSSSASTFRLYYYDTNKNWLSRTDGITQNPPYTFTTPSNCYYMQFQFITSIYDASTIQIEEGQATTYQPYGEGWFNKKEIGKIASYNGETITTNYISTTGGLDTGATLYYVLSTPTYTKITDETLISQLEDLQETTSYRDTTNITQSNNDLSFNMDVLSYTNPLDLTRNGLGYLPNVLSAYVVDAINGEYSLTFEYPMNDAMSDEIKEGRIVKCKVADGSNQCFIIKNIEKTYEKMVVKCTHLFYMLLEDFIDDSYPQNLSPKPFLDWLLHRMNYPLPFTTTSNVATTKTGRYVRRNMVDIILGDSDNSMKNLFGIELERDNWNIGLKARIGTDHGEKLIYGKNINGINVSIDDTGVYTRIMPIGFDGLLLPEEYVDAPNINDYPYPRICLYSFPNIKYDPNDAEAYHTQEEAYQALRDATNELYTNKINYPKININIDWLELSKTEEYKNYSALERVHLGDTITSNIFGMDYETRVIQTTYNPLNDRVEGFEIGTFQPTFTSYTTKLSEQVKEVNPDNILAEAQANATNLITSAMGGYVYKTNNELYIMDTDDPSTAQCVWRWNINGLGYSSTGINGTYGLAMTMDGQIVADFITTGQIDTSVINGYDSLTTQVYANTNDLTNVNSDLQQYKSQVATQFTQTATDFTYQFNNVNQLITDVSNTTSDNFEEIHKYIRFIDGKIILGEEGNSFTAELSNNELAFLQNGTKVAYVSNNKLYITNAEIMTNIIIGNFQYIPRNNGSLSFRKV